MVLAILITLTIEKLVVILKETEEKARFIKYLQLLEQLLLKMIQKQQLIY